VVIGVDAFDLNGNGLNNALTGNAAVNRLFGSTGDDTLGGGLGDDSLYGGAGNDTYVLTDTHFVSYGEDSFDFLYDTVSEGWREASTRSGSRARQTRAHTASETTSRTGWSRVRANSI
jgi:Ca2+-binding RTX toxin-like protein